MCGVAPRSSVGAGKRDWCMTCKRLPIAFSQGYPFLLHPPAVCLGTSCMSLGLVTLLCPRIWGFFHSLYCLYYFLQLQTSNNGFSQVDSAIFQIRMMLLKPGLPIGMWKLRQKGVTSVSPEALSNAYQSLSCASVSSPNNWG